MSPLAGSIEPTLHPWPCLETERLVIRPGAPSDVPAILQFFRANEEHLRPTDPVRPPSFFTEEYWLAQVERNRADFERGVSARFFLFPREASGLTVGGVANLNEIVRGCFHSCFLGYSLSQGLQGRGLMSEGLRALIRFGFEDLRLHRISANYMPHNVRSGRLLKKLGFAAEGYARDYLQINGRWEDHVLTALLNPAWTPPES